MFWYFTVSQFWLWLKHIEEESLFIKASVDKNFLSLGIYESQDSRGKGDQTPLYHFHLLHKQEFSRTITAECSLLHIAS